MNYDIFISFKNLDADGKKSRDCEIAEELYRFLQSKGLSVFFSNYSLERLGSSAYLKAIDNALDSAKIMVVVGTSKANIESQWVESEWSGFINDIRSGIKKNAQIYSVIEGMSTVELQRSLRQYQSFTYSKENLARLYNFISNALGGNTSSQQNSSTENDIVPPVQYFVEPEPLPNLETAVSENTCKLNITIGVIGSDNHGKTTLTAAIVTVLEKYVVSKQQRETANNGGCVQYQTNKRFYSSVLYGPHEDFVKYMVAGYHKFAGAIVVVDVMEGVTSQVREQILLARQSNVPRFVVFLNKIDMLEDTESIDLTEVEIRELLSYYGYDGDNTPVICGSALGALNGMSQWEGKILELMDTVDEYIPSPIKDMNKPFLMPIEDVFSITGRGVVLTGKIENGIVRVQDTLEIVGLSDKTKTVTCIGIEMFRKLVDQGEAGDNVGLLMRGITKEDVKRGMVIAKQGCVKAYKKFEAEVYFLSKDEGGSSTPIYNNYCPQFYLRTLDVLGKITLPEGISQVGQGNNVLITVELTSFAAINVGLHFAIRDNNKTIGAGLIRRVF